MTAIELNARLQLAQADASSPIFDAVAEAIASGDLSLADRTLTALGF